MYTYCCLQTKVRMLKHFLQSSCILISHSRATSLNLYKAHLVRFSQIDFIIIWREPQVSLHWGNRVKIDMSFVRSFLFVTTFLLSAELVLFLSTKTEYCPHYVCISFHRLTQFLTRDLLTHFTMNELSFLTQMIYYLSMWVNLKLDM